MFDAECDRQFEARPLCGLARGGVRRVQSGQQLRAADLGRGRGRRTRTRTTRTRTRTTTSRTTTRTTTRNKKQETRNKEQEGEEQETTDKNNKNKNNKNNKNKKTSAGTKNSATFDLYLQRVTATALMQSGVSVPGGITSGPLYCRELEPGLGTEFPTPCPQHAFSAPGATRRAFFAGRF